MCQKMKMLAFSQTHRRPLCLLQGRWSTFVWCYPSNISSSPAVFAPPVPVSPSFHPYLLSPFPLSPLMQSCASNLYHSCLSLSRWEQWSWDLYLCVWLCSVPLLMAPLQPYLIFLSFRSSSFSSSASPHTSVSRLPPSPPSPFPAAHPPSARLLPPLPIHSRQRYKQNISINVFMFSIVNCPSSFAVEMNDDGQPVPASAASSAAPSAAASTAAAAAAKGEDRPTGQRCLCQPTTQTDNYAQPTLDDASEGAVNSYSSHQRHQMNRDEVWQLTQLLLLLLPLLIKLLLLPLRGVLLLLAATDVGSTSQLTNCLFTPSTDPTSQHPPTIDWSNNESIVCWSYQS